MDTLLGQFGVKDQGQSLLQACALGDRHDEKKKQQVLVLVQKIPYRSEDQYEWHDMSAIATRAATKSSCSSGAAQFNLSSRVLAGDPWMGDGITCQGGGGGKGQPREHVEEKVQVVRERMERIYTPFTLAGRSRDQCMRKVGTMAIVVILFVSI